MAHSISKPGNHVALLLHAPRVSSAILGGKSNIDASAADIDLRRIECREAVTQQLIICDAA